MPYMQAYSAGSFPAIPRQGTGGQPSVGGWTVENGRDALSGGVDGHNYSDKYKGYDLLILSFGMNNAHTSKEEYIAATKAIVDKIKKDNQNLEVILVSCMNSNPAWAGM